MCPTPCFARKIVALIAACLIPLIYVRQAGCAAAGPVEYVSNMLDAVMAIQNNPEMAGPEHREERRSAIKAVISRNIDMADMAKSALSDHWQELDEKQRAEFTSIFQDLFQDAYTRLVLDFLKQEQIRYSPAENVDGETIVKTLIFRPNEQIPVDYRLAITDGKWRIRDVVIDGVSITGKYRNSFNRVIKGSSFNNLIEKMRLQQKAIQ